MAIFEFTITKLEDEYSTGIPVITGEKGDPGVVQSVNGKSEQEIILTPEDIGADPAGSATQAELNAKQYTDTAVAQAIAEVLSKTIELE